MLSDGPVKMPVARLSRYPSCRISSLDHDEMLRERPHPFIIHHSALVTSYCSLRSKRRTKC